MRYKKIMILTIILTCLLAVSAVSATDNYMEGIVGSDVDICDDLQLNDIDQEDMYETYVEDDLNFNNVTNNDINTVVSNFKENEVISTGNNESMLSANYYEYSAHISKCYIKNNNLIYDIDVVPTSYNVTFQCYINFLDYDGKIIYYSQSSEMSTEWSSGFGGELVNYKDFGFKYPGTYTLNVCNKEDNHLMDTGYLYIKSDEDAIVSIKDKTYYASNPVKIYYTYKKRATGTLSIYLNDEYVKTIPFKEAIDLGYLTPGNYNLKVCYSGDGAFDSQTIYKNFNVLKTQPNIKINTTNFYFNEEVKLNYTIENRTTGNLSIYINDSFVDTVQIGDEINLGYLDVGVYNLKVVYDGDACFYSQQLKTNLNILKLPSNITFDVEDINWNDPLMLNPKVTSNATGFIEIYVNDVYKDNISVGSNYILNGIGGPYSNITLVYLGDGTYNQSSHTEKVYVARLNTTCMIDGNVEADSYSRVSVALNEDATGIVSITILGNRYAESLVDGAVTFRVPNLKVGIYNLTINYEGDSKYNSFYKNDVINVTLKNTLLSLNLKNIVVGNNSVINPSISSGATGYISIYVDGVFKQKINIGSSYVLTKPRVGKHEVKMIYNSDGYFKSCENSTVFWVFSQYPIEAKDTYILHNSSNYFKVRFFDEQHNSLSNKYVVFHVNGKDYARLTDYYGYATLDLDFDIGIYNITSINTIYNENRTNKLIVFTSIESENLTRAYNSGCDFNATFLDDTAKPLSNTYVVFKMNDSDFTVKTDMNGRAILNVPLIVGTHEILSINTFTNENKTNKVTIVPSIHAEDMVRAYNSSFDYKAIFTGSNGDALNNTAVTFEVNNVLYEIITDCNGTAILNISLAVGEYNITAINPVTDEKSTNKLIIVPRIINNTDIELFTDVEDYFSVRVVDDDGTFCGRGEIVVFTLHNTSYNVKTNEEGFASLLISSLNKGMHSIAVNYKGFIAHNNITVFEDLDSIMSIDVNDVNYTQKVLLNVSVLPKYGHGNMTIDIFGANGYNITFNHMANEPFIEELSGLNASDYVVAVKFWDNDNYYVSQDTSIFEVSKITPNVIVVVDSVQFSQNATVTVNIPQASGNVTIKIGNQKTYNEFIPADGVIIKRLNDLQVGEYEVVVTYGGNNNYNNLTKIAMLNITTMPSDLILFSKSEFNYGQRIVVNLTSSVDGIVKVQFDEDIQFLEVIANKIYQISYENYESADYTLVATLTPTNNIYDISRCELEIRVDKIFTDLRIIAEDIEFGQSTNITAIINPSATGNIKLKANDQVYTQNVINGIVKFNIAGFETGNYSLEIIYDGDNNFIGTNGLAIFKVVKITENNSSDIKPTPEVVIPPLDKPSDDGSVTISLPSDATGIVTLNINGKDYPFAIVNGKANVLIPNLGDGNYPYTITYSGDSKYSTFTTNGSLNKVAPAVDPVITASNAKVTYSAGSYYTIKVNGTDGKLADGVTVKITGKISKTLTTTNGVAKFKVTQVPGTYKITITALEKSVSKTITVKHIVTLKTVTLKKSAKKLTLQATLAKVNGKYLKKKTITFKINGKKVATAKTNSKGVAKITIKNPNVVKKLKVGKKVTYQATYLKDTVKKTVKVKK